MPRLVNEELTNLVDKLSTYKDKLSESAYEQYKSALVLTQTINLRGKAGDALKQYINLSHIHLTQKMINVSAEILEVAEKMKADFANFESMNNGIVGSGTLDQVRDRMKKTNEHFTDIDERADQLLYQAEEFISVTSLGTGNVTQAYTSIYDHINQTKTGLEDTDSNLQSNLDRLVIRVSELQTQIFELSEVFRDDHGIKYSKLKEIPKQEWYTVENNHAFQEMQADDPFSYYAGHGSMEEGQWVAGTSDTNYITTSGYVVGAEGELTTSGSFFDNSNPFTVEGNGSAAVLSGDVQGETLWGYGKLDASGRLFGADGSMYFGPRGADLEGKVAYFDADATVMIGHENFNGYASGNVDFLTAEGHARFKLPEGADDDVKIGLGGKANGASVGFDAGISLFEVDSADNINRETGEKVKKSILGVDAGVNIGLQAGGGFDFSSEAVYSNDYLNVRANELDVNLRLGAGVKFSVAVPSIQLKWPW